MIIHIKKTLTRTFIILIAGLTLFTGCGKSEKQVIRSNSDKEQIKPFTKKGLIYNDEWINEQVTVKKIEKDLSDAEIDLDKLDVKTLDGRVFICGAVTNKVVSEKIQAVVMNNPYVLEFIPSIKVYNVNLYSSPINGIRGKWKDSRITRKVKSTIKKIKKTNTSDTINIADITTINNKVIIYGKVSSEEFKEKILSTIKKNKDINSIIDFLTVSPENLEEISISDFEILITSQANAIKNKMIKSEILQYGATKLLENNMYKQSESMFAEVTELNQKQFSGPYGLAYIAAEEERYEDALQLLKVAVSQSDFELSSKDVKEDFKSHPIIVMAIPDDIRQLIFQTVQLFEVRDTLIENQEKFAELFVFSDTPSPETIEARRALNEGNFDAAFVNYMRFVMRQNIITDQNLDQILEALSIWRFAYQARVSQIAMALYDTGGEREVGAKCLRMVCNERRSALEVIAQQEPPAVVDQYKGKYGLLLNNRTSMVMPNVASAIKDPLPVATMEKCLIGCSFAATGLSEVIVETKDQKQKKKIIEWWDDFPSFQILDWKEATIDYSDQKNKYKQCMQILDKIIEKEKTSGSLSAASIDRLYKAKSSMIQYQIYVDKLYRSFLFDAPLVLTLVAIDGQLEYALQPVFNNDNELIKKAGRRYAKITPIVKYIALDNTHEAWQMVNKKIKKELSEKNFNELVQQSKTQPNWLTDLD